ncbi:ABC transporter substrate-binding protein [Chlorogloeopsis sp. ULAP01]|uniref:ABC transporter substrate-binding protein n=1 Tax=Chlorogloeopsis sp. ULAP01 TaxID=3056483 RepID=UPI0025AB3F49|nr:ABC transporter substrate-binding protein [Chlorogloeopsis sp. ULAP01]MDM9380571.1 ABC transporter substrate-binding protein [Chlorogloeopsis sp. ULAP01]
MSQKNETAVLALSVLITLGLVGGGFWWLKDKILPQSSPGNNLLQSSNQAISERISFGEKFLTPREISPIKKESIAALASGSYEKAISNLQAALQLQKNDPEALIFLNNARIGVGKNYTIVASVPLGTDLNSSLEILRGVAQAQNEINTAGGIKGVPLKVGIANDDNHPEIAKQIAKVLVNNPQVLGVVGPYASDVTLAAGTIYTSGELVAISPVSTSVKISNFSRYIFRTVPSDFMAARALARYTIENLQKKNVAVFFNSQSNYSQSLKSEFVSSVSLEGGQVSTEFDLSQSNFSAAKSVEQAIKQGAEVLMLAANTNTLDKALQVVQVNQKRLKLLGGDDVYTSKTLEIGREQAVEMVLAVPWHIDGMHNSDFPRQSRQLWGADVNWRTALAYDAAKALIEGLKSNPTRIGVQQALSTPEFSPTGASGSVRFLPSGDRNAAVQLVKIVSKNSSRSGTGFDFVPVQLSAMKN